MTDLTCFDCINCDRSTMICNTYNMSVADNHVHPWECPKFAPKRERIRLEFHVPESLDVTGVERIDTKAFVYLKKRKE